MPIDYDKIRDRINGRCRLLSVSSVPGMSRKRLNRLRVDAHGISTLELARLSAALHVSIAWLVGIKEAP